MKKLSLTLAFLLLFFGCSYQRTMTESDRYDLKSEIKKEIKVELSEELKASIMAYLISEGLFLPESANRMYWCTALTGGAAGALDEIDGANLADLDAAIIVTLTGSYLYSLDADSAAGESSPDIISPDTNAGDKRWILASLPIITDGTDPYLIKVVQEPGLGGRLTFAVNEVPRTVAICDYSDVDTDWGASIPSYPLLRICGTTPTDFATYSAFGVDTGQNYVFSHRTLKFQTQYDVSIAGDLYTFNSAANKELTDLDSAQSWVFLDGKVNQVNADSGAAGYSLLKGHMLETDADEGTINYMLYFGTDTTADVFAVDSKGRIVLA